METEENVILESKIVPNFVIKVSHEAKLKELLRNINSTELQSCSEASREFMKLLRGDEGGEMLRQYVQTSSSCSELLQAWNLRQSKAGLSNIMSLISVLLSHKDGVYKPNDAARFSVSRALDKFARLILEEKLGDVYKELNSKEGKGKNAALLLMSSIVKRGSGMASDVAKSFDFKLPAFLKLAKYDKRRKNMEETKKKSSTRRSFVKFAMSFLEIGEPRLLRWVLQQKEMFSGVLRGLWSDEEETVFYVLSTLGDKVLVPESLVPVGLRSVLFGSATLEQLINISGRNDGGVATEVAQKVLFMVCTDPSNGLMPDAKALPNPLKGNLVRLLGVMKKLKATEIEFHRDLLLAIVRGRPAFGSAYLDEFPYNLEDNATWFAAVSLAANLISSVNAGLSFDFLDAQALEPPSFSSSEVQSVIKCIGPRSFTRIVLNKGLLHSDSLIKHGTLRLVLEALKLLDSLFCAVNHKSDSNKQIGCKWTSFKQNIQNEVQLLFPDHQVLLSLISSLNIRHKSEERSLKRAADAEALLNHCSNSKKSKIGSSNEETDILVGGISSSLDIALPGDNGRIEEVDNVNDFNNLNNHARIIAEIWKLHKSNNPNMAAEVEATIFYSKLLDTLKVYHRTMPTVMEGSFDFFKVLPANVLSLPTILQQALLSLLVEHIGWSSNYKMPIRCPPLMYKHLMQFINLVIHSSVRDIKDQAYVLAQAAMSSTGAFDNDAREIDAWFLFLPGFSTKSFEDMGIETIPNLSSVVVSFFCDVVSTTGNNLFKYWDLLRFQIHQLEGTKDVNPHFSPLVVCALEKCLRLLGSESGTFSLPEKSMISIYVSNTLRYLLQTQVEAGLLSSLICVLLSERLEDVDKSGDLCEWRPLRSLLCFARSITDQHNHMIFSIDRKTGCGDNSFVNLLSEVSSVVKSGQNSGITTAFSFAMLCAEPDLILRHFPAVVSISHNLQGVPFSILLSIFFLERSFLSDICKLWPDVSFAALERAVASIHGEDQIEEDCYSTDSPTSASVAFAYFLKQAPFYVLFPAIMSIELSNLSQHSKLQDLLLSKLSEEMSDNFVSSFRLVLFWFHHIQSSYRHISAEEHVQISEICSTLMKSMLAHISSGKHDSDRLNILLAPASNHQAQELAEIIFCHPAIVTSLQNPLSGNMELKDDIFVQSSHNFLCLAREGVHKMDHHVLTVLETFCTHLFSNELRFTDEVVCANKHIVRVFKSLLQKLVLVLKDRFDQFITSKDSMTLVPTLYALHKLIHFISLPDLLELVNWMFSRLDLNESGILESPKVSALSVGLNVAACAFDLLLCYAEQRNVKEVPFWFSDTKEFDVLLFERIYLHVVEIVCHWDSAVADLCLLKAVKVANAHEGLRTQFLRQCMVMSRIVASTPLKLLSKCVQRTNVTRAQLVFHLTKSSPMHLSFFAFLFWGRVSKSSSSKRKSDLLDNDLIMLLPTALSYLSSSSMRYQKFYKHFRSILSLYWEIFLNGFSNWTSFVSRDLFQVELGEPLPSTVEKLLDLVDDSFLGRAVTVMRHYLVSSGASVKRKKRLKLFDSVLPSGTVNLLDCDVSEIDHYSLDQSLNLITKAVTKINLCEMLLFHKENTNKVLPKEGEEVDEDIKQVSVDVVSNKEYLRRVLFVNTMVSTWQLIVKKFPSRSNARSKVEAAKFALFRLMEIVILRIIIKLTAEMDKSSDVKSDSLTNLEEPANSSSLTTSNRLTNLEELAKSCFLHRFEDPATLTMLGVILTFSTDDNSLNIRILQLLLAHSQFAPTIQSASKTSSCLQFGIIFRPMSSILRSLTFASTALVEVNVFELYMKQLEIVKLLRVLCSCKARLATLGSEQDIGINSRELLFLLLSSYSATLSEVDLEIYNLMLELESTDESSSNYIVDMDYLWGNAAIRVRKVRETEQAFSSDMDDAEAVEKRRKSHFRENLPIDPRMCAATVLHFPYDRNLNARALHDKARYISKEQMTNAERKQIYDPVFILHMSFHGLTMGYIEPMEYASLGLLAVAFVSLSSPDDGIRRLGYKVLAVFRNALEICQKRKDVTRLRPLMTYVQNGIEEPWRRIPSIHALFAAEASLLLLDPSNDHYKTISKLLTQSPMNTKTLPFFDEFFWSSSVNFISERIWMLRLLYSGLNIDEDAQIYVRNSVLEKLLNFYSSPLSDNGSRELILQIVKKSIKFDKTSRYMVERCGAISWLSSLISNFCKGTYREERGVSATQFAVILEIVKDVITSRNTIQWLQHAPEQLSQLSCHLFMLLTGSFELVKEINLVDSILEILASTLKISQKRDALQPRFSLSIDGIFQLSQAIDACDKEYSPSAEIVLKIVLMSTPQAAMISMDQEKLQKFVLWAASTALRSLEESDNRPEYCFEKEETEDSLISKLLRWLTASVIIGKLSRKFEDMESKHYPEKSESLQPLLADNGSVRVVSQTASGSEDLLAATIYYLQQILGSKCEVLTSVVTSLCLLLFPDSSHTGLDVLPDDGSTFASLISRIGCPDEVNPSWRWSFERPWKNPSSNNSFDVEETQACKSLLLVISNVVGKKSSLSRFISNEDVENSGVFKWERSLLVETE